MRTLQPRTTWRRSSFTARPEIGSAHKIGASRAIDRTSIATALRGDAPHWTLEARFAALARAGSAATPEVAAELIEVVVPALTPSGRPFDNTHRVAADALAELALAVDVRAAGPLAQLLLDLAGDEDYSRVKAGRYGLRMLSDIGRFTDIDALIARFAQDGRPDQPTPSWIAEHLTTEPRVALVRQAALAGHQPALAALLLADKVRGDDALRELCRRITTNMLSSDLGRTPDGKGIWGLMALDTQGAIAAGTDDDVLKAAAAEVLLAYALENRWPMVNRVSAVAGLWPLIDPGIGDQWLKRLRALARPDIDLDDDAARRSREMWSQRGDLEAMALKVCASHRLADGAPDWLDNSVREAFFDPRAPIRAAAWFAARRRPAWFDPHSVRHALRDSSVEVQVAALAAWQLRAEHPLPPAVLLRLMKSGDLATKMAVIWLVKEQFDDRVASALRADPDAYVRETARRELAPATA